MSSNLPEGLQSLKPFIQRANEVKRKNPLVAYYCRTYAAQLGIDVIQGPDVTKAQTDYVLQLMDELEREKEELKPEGEEGRMVVEIFALTMFGKAEQALQNGRCDKILAKIFYTSSILMEVCKQFGELAEDIQKKQKYARWRAAQITKAVNAGETIDLSEDNQMQQDNRSTSSAGSSHTPNPFQQYRKEDAEAMDTTGDDDFSKLQQQFNQENASGGANSLTSSTHSSSSATNYNQNFPKDLPPPSSSNQFNQPPPPPTQYNQPPAGNSSIGSTPHTPASSTSNPMNNGGSSYVPQQGTVDDLDIEEAQKFTKYAISALQFYDVPVAIQNLKDALAKLGHPV